MLCPHRGVTRGGLVPGPVETSRPSEGELPPGSDGFLCDTVLKWLLPADFFLFVFPCSVCTLSSMKRNHLQLENISQLDMQCPTPVPVFVLCKEMVKERLCFAR